MNMKSFKQIFVCVCLLGFTCAREHSLMPSDAESGSVRLAVKLGAVGKLAKRTAIVLDTLMIRLSASGEEPIVDRVAVGGSDEQAVIRAYSGLASLKTWTATASTRDTAGKIIHSGTVTFEVNPGEETTVTIGCPSRYSMLTANFFPRRDSVERYLVIVDDEYGAATSYGAAEQTGDTIKLFYDYLTASPQGVLHRIRMRAEGGAAINYAILYQADTVVTVYSGHNASYRVVLRHRRPDSTPGAASMTVILGASGAVSVDGELEEPHVPAQLYVDSSAAAGGDGLTWGSAFNDLQKAIGKAEMVVKANPGASVDVYVAAGTYFPSVTGDAEESFFLRNNVRLIGGFPTGGGARDIANKTILSGAKGCVHVIRALNVDSTAIIEGLTITGPGQGMSCVGASPKVSDCDFVENHWLVGGAVYDSLSSPVFIHCSFSGNGGGPGGGIFNFRSSPILVNCEFTRNGTGGITERDNLGGAGVCNVLSSPVITDCFFYDNEGNSGAAISNSSQSSPTITRCVFKGNFAEEFEGGAIANSSSDPVISHCIFDGNSACDGGGGAIYNEYSSPKIDKCSFFGNRNRCHWARSNGGAIANYYSSSPMITNCTFDSNSTQWMAEYFSGGALFDDSTSSSIVTNCTFTNNSSTYGPAYYGVKGILTNCIFWGDTARDTRILHSAVPAELPAGLLNVRNCIVCGGYPGGISIINADPRLGSLMNNGGGVPTCAIPEDSPARDAGTTQVPAGVDILRDGNCMPRSDGKPDIGAYEVQ
jgi:hypothetical protein